MDSNSIHLGPNEAEGGMSAAGIGSMTTDAFTTAARAEAGTLYAVDWDTPAYYDGEDRREAEQFLAGAEWARDHLAAHSDLTVDSEAVTVESDEPTDARAALTAARQARP